MSFVLHRSAILLLAAIRRPAPQRGPSTPLEPQMLKDIGLEGADDATLEQLGIRRAPRHSGITARPWSI